ncbi:hypothetical protein SUGI_0794320 [Cryptomeria japonica]|uniref:scopoletin glucosyltransferase n=1 Tax=Cryptomeria japonica TaxID=3369 RepID=UPI002414ACDF|nr:scopoletin glucosyltransferase [Cryptomeria japonica]GLJ38962.1 hypothetical protein SUGI_0794320 [Cryptomeria japonica]
MEEVTADALAFPLLAQGHIIPFMRLCELLSSKNLNVVFLTSPLNANRLRANKNHSSSVRVMDIPLPPVPGLPSGAENTDQLTPSQFKTLFAAMEQMEPSFRELVARLKPKCFIADFSPLFLPAVADELKIPVFYYATTGAYSLSIMKTLIETLPLPSDQTGAFPLQDLPKSISLKNSDLLPPYRGAGRTPFPHGFLSTVFERLGLCGGLVINTFEEMEGEFLDHLKNIFRVSVWSVGPILNRPSGGLGETTVEEWLDCRSSGSVLYVNFGSEIALPLQQIHEVAAGLEASGHCFLWSVKKPVGMVDVQEESFDLFPPGFQERTADRGLLIFGWAPQQAILSHPSIGGFLSHCGWNSTLESISNGVPILAWPFQHDQPFVKKLLVEELCNAEEIKRDAAENGVFVVKSAEVERAVKLIMEEDKGKDMRTRAGKLKTAALRAVGEGGSSISNLESFASLIQNIRSK